MPDLPAILDALREKPADGPRWLVLAGWVFDNGRDDEAVAVRVYWPVLRDNLARASLESTLADVARHSRLLGQREREVEGRGRVKGSAVVTAGLSGTYRVSRRFEVFRRNGKK
jgi:hypothetical protein